jgi:cytochrome b561
MALLNSSTGYGTLTKVLHWSIAVLFAWQYVSATVMLNTPQGQTTFGVSQDAYFNWHKSLGLVALALAVVRLLNRRAGELPPWAPSLTAPEQMLIHRAEQLLYAAMLIMPLSGYVYVTAGGYGVQLFGLVHLPSLFGPAPAVAAIAKAVHIASAFLLLLPLGLHLGLVLGHQFGLRDGILDRMLARRSDRRPGSGASRPQHPRDL